VLRVDGNLKYHYD